MARPLKDFRLKRNGNSMQLYIRGEFAGSRSLSALCQFYGVDPNYGTTPVLAQPSFKNESADSPGSGTEEAVPAKGADEWG